MKRTYGLSLATGEFHAMLRAQGGAGPSGASAKPPLNYLAGRQWTAVFDATVSGDDPLILTEQATGVLTYHACLTTVGVLPSRLYRFQYDVLGFGPSPRTVTLFFVDQNYNYNALAWQITTIGNPDSLTLYDFGGTPTNLVFYQTTARLVGDGWMRTIVDVELLIPETYYLYFLLSENNQSLFNVYVGDGSGATIRNLLLTGGT